MKRVSTLKARDGYLIVSSVWLISCILGAIPFLVSGTFDNFIDAFFESCSGFTTTGATVIDDLGSVSRPILFWRALTHWLGGMGIVVFFMALIPSFGINGQIAAYSETPGPSKGKITARFTDTAKNLYFIYTGFTAAEVIILKISNMSWFDAVTTAFSTMGTGGFANTGENAGAFSTPAKITVILFMLLAGLNFNLYYKALRHGIRAIFRDQEARFYICIIIVWSVLIFSGLIFYGTYSDLPAAFLDSIFHVISIITTTGFTFGNYEVWPTFSKIMLFLLFFVGGCACSTGGGIKVSRIQIVLKLIKRSFSLRVHPYRVAPLTINNAEISTETTIRSTGFIFMYLVTLLGGSLLLSLNQLDFITGLTSAASCLGNIGPGFGLVGPAFTYSSLSGFSKLVCSFLMIAGRLELYTVFVLFSGYYWNPNKSR